MATLTLIGEPFPDLEARTQASAAHSLAEALADTAPRGCSSRLLVARDATPPVFHSARASVEAVPMNTGSLPILWRTGATARPLDGEFVHSNTPMVPLRSRAEDDGSQTSVYIPHTLAWSAPELMGAAQAKAYRAFVKRAARLADTLLAPTHVVANEISERFGVDVQVLPLAAPVEYVGTEESAGIRSTLGLPSHYIATTALPGENGRLDWLLNAMEANPALPPLVIIYLGTEPLPPMRESLQHRARVVQVEQLAEVGAILSGAMFLALPQRVLGAGYEVLGAIASHVPVLYGECEAAAELALDAAVSAPSEAEFAAALARLTSEAGAAELARLRIFAEDRNRTYGWRSTAWQLWEIHANM